MDISNAIKEILQKINSLERRINTLGGGSGEANTGANIGVGGVGPYDSKVGVELRFRNINAAAGGRLTVALDNPNHEIDLDVDPSAIDLDDLGNVDIAAPADGEVLTYDALTGDWKNEAGGGGGSGALNKHNFRRSGMYYTAQETGYLLGTIALARDYLYAIPFIVPIQQIFDLIAIYVVTGQDGGVGELAIYEDNGDVYPGNLIFESMELNFAAAGQKSDSLPASAGGILTPGLYWLVLWHDTYPNPTFRAINYNYDAAGIIGYSTSNGTRPYLYWSKAKAYNVENIPDPFPAGATYQDNANLPAIMLRVA
jgi:hypothetical protein